MTYELIFHNGFKLQKGQGSPEENSISWGSKVEMQVLKKRLDDAFAGPNEAQREYTLQEFVLGEDREEGCSFFALYAGLRMYMELKSGQSLNKGMFFVSAGEAFCMLKQLEKIYPDRFLDAKKEYDTSMRQYSPSPAQLIAQMTRATICDQDFLMQNGKWFYTQYGEKHGPFKTLIDAYGHFDLF